MTYIEIGKTFSGLRGHRVHIVRISANTLISALEHLGFQAFLINGSVISDKTSFMDEIARALNFPSYFGKNWDAVHDCMLDFGEDLEQPNAAIIWRDVDKLLSIDLQTFTEAICFLHEDISMISKQIELFLIGNDDRFPVIEVVK